MGWGKRQKGKFHWGIFLKPGKEGGGVTSGFPSYLSPERMSLKSVGRSRMWKKGEELSANGAVYVDMGSVFSWVMVLVSVTLRPDMCSSRVVE